MNKKNIIIAVDGLSSSGKSTISKIIAKKFNFKYIDTGSIYRCITLLAINKNVFNSNLWNIKNFIPFVKNINIKICWNYKIFDNDIFLNEKNVRNKIRSINVTEKVAFIARIPEIRNIVTKIIKKNIINKNKGFVIDGRDIGNYMFPDSNLKFFIKSPIDIRSYRKYKYFLKKGFESISYEKIKKNIIIRDEIDICRKYFPLIKSADHIEINNCLSIGDQTNLMFKIINKEIYETFKKKISCSYRRNWGNR
ncbi:(d)CMP kinase [Blattabacterium cuenoti]|uniref:(d)CMP kinase n=1 Tax=Blattabacterium cuenoti TaxID=1653831 RepID=UPI00163CA368|nr:(d)CMP kinase [Blattabacterium cuenoti]